MAFGRAARGCFENEASTLCWPAPGRATLAAQRALPLHTTVQLNIQAIMPVMKQKPRHLFFCQQTFISTFSADAFPRFNVGEHHPASKHTLFSLKVVCYNTEWQWLCDRVGKNLILWLPFVPWKHCGLLVGVLRFPCPSPGSAESGGGNT